MDPLFQGFRRYWSLIRPGNRAAVYFGGAVGWQAHWSAARRQHHSKK